MKSLHHIGKCTPNKLFDFTTCSVSEWLNCIIFSCYSTYFIKPTRGYSFSSNCYCRASLNWAAALCTVHPPVTCYPVCQALKPVWLSGSDTWTTRWNLIWAPIDDYASACCELDLFTPKPNRCVSRPRYICDLILVNLAPMTTKKLHSHNFPDHCLLSPLTFWPQNLTSTSMNQNTSETNLVKFHSLAFEMSCSQGFRVIACSGTQTHSRMDTPDYWMPLVAFFSGGGGKICII